MAERINQRTNPLIGKNIIRLRSREHLKQAEVIARLGQQGINIKSGAFSKIENGGNNPSVAMLTALTGILNCDFNDFFQTE